MSISVNFYQTGKRVNSTKIPAQVPGDIGISVELKDVTNLFTPTLILSADLFTDAQGHLENPMKFVYCYISDFSRYYFIRSWSWILGRWECSLEVDVLASFKSAIGETSAYVLRSASDYDGAVVDTKYVTKGGALSLIDSHNTTWETNLSSTTVSSGFFVIGIVNNDSNAIGATSYYAVNAVGLRKFMAELYASPAWMNITDASISTDLQKMMMNPIQYIVSCQWIPCALDTSGLTSLTTIPVGWWNVTVNSNDPLYQLTGSSLKLKYTMAFDIPKHPGAADAHLGWLLNAPYSQYQVQYYPYGVFSIDSAKLIGYDKLFCVNDIDLVTGIGTLTITRGIGLVDYGIVIYSTTAQIGIPISLAQMSVDMSRLNNGATWAGAAGLALANNGFLSQASDYASDYVAQASGNIKDIWNNKDYNAAQKIWETIKYPFSAQHQNLGQQYSGGRQADIGSLIGTVQTVATDIGNAVLASSGVCQTVGATGALAQYTLPQELTLFYYNIVDQSPAFYGYPLCTVKQIKTLSGFVLCATEGDLTVAANPTERQAIIAYMKAGFYYE